MLVYYINIVCIVSNIPNTDPTQSQQDIEEDKDYKFNTGKELLFPVGNGAWYL